MKRIKVGVIGCGMISEIYLRNLTTVFRDVTEVTACADLNMEAARKRAEQFGTRAVSIEQLLADPEIRIIVNLTVPAAHYEIAKETLQAGKNAYSEKPLALCLDEGKELLKCAREKDLLVTAAPDTFLGGGLQTCREIIDSGLIGTPVSAQGFMLAKGPESFHPNPEFFYKRGAGPLFDMGPYYLTALVSIFGAVKRVAGMSKKTFGCRKTEVKNSPLYGQQFEVGVDTFISGNLEFQSGLIANVTVSWDMSNEYWDAGVPLLEVFGTKGTLILPDPNTFGGIGDSPSAEPGKYVIVRRGSEDTEQIKVKGDYTENSRGLGVADLAWHLLHGGEPRVSGENALHVLEIMQGLLESSETGCYHTMSTACRKPELLGTFPFGRQS